jgi:2-polyprenyl-3-methyl-5-hydroxy-6-metoxy-1,4-benzoquinol methylase
VSVAVATRPEPFRPLTTCWVCGTDGLDRYHRARLDFTEYAGQDPQLHAYTGEHVWMVRCRACGFGQPEVVPTLARFFDRMYDQRWSAAWVEQEFGATYKDVIFRGVLDELDRQVLSARRRLLDVGAHAGRFMHLAQLRGWTVEGIELNPRTAAFAANRTGAPVHRVNAHGLANSGHRYSAIVLTDVLEHVPEPGRLLSGLAALLEPDGVVAIKVPNGSAQWFKERWLARVSSHRVSLAENLVHVNQFTPRSLAYLLERSGLSAVQVRTAAPELPPVHDLRSAIASLVRRGVFLAASSPVALRTPLALHLQAFARRGPS